MNLFVFQRTAVTEQGNVIPNAEITVYAAGTATAVDLFDDSAGTPKGNPFNAGPTDAEADGFIQFYVAFGNYDIAVNGTVLWENETIGRPELNDITALSSLNTAALVDGQQFSVLDGRKVRHYKWDAATSEFIEVVSSIEIRASQFGADTGDAGPKLKAMWEYAAGRPTVIDVDCSVSTKIDLVDTDIDCRVLEGITIDCTGLPAGTALGQQYFLKASGSVANSSAVTADVEPYADNRTLANQQSSVTVLDGNKFSPGDITILRSNQLFDDEWTGSSSNKRGEMLKVKSVSGNEVFFHDKIRFSYLASESCVLEKTAPIQFRWDGGSSFGGGVGSAHSFLIVDIAEDISINSECDGFEDIGFQIKRTYGATGFVKPKRSTSPGGSVGTTGYGVAFYDGTRYVDFTVHGLLCRHMISGGGLLPAIDVKAKGIAVDCGINAAAIDCHEPCFGWDLDFITRGGTGGAGIRGSDITINLDVRDGDRGLVITTVGTVSAQKNIKFNLKAYGLRGAPLQILGEDSPIKNVEFGSVDIENCRLDAFTIWGDVDGVKGGSARIRDTWLRDGEGGNSGMGLFLNGQTYTVGDRVRNVVIDKLDVQGVLSWGVRATWVEGLRIGDIRVNGSSGLDGVRIEDSAGIAFDAGSIAHVSDLYACRTDRVSNVKISCELITDGNLSGSVGWRAIDTSDAILIASPRIVSQSSGAIFSGSSDNIIITNNNAAEVLSATTFNTGSAVNTVVGSNLT